MSHPGRRFAELIEPHLDAVFRAAFRLARDPADAEDLVQETCLRAYRQVLELDGSRNVKAWLLRVLNNVFIDDVRRSRRSAVISAEHGTDRANSLPCSDSNPEEATYTIQREEQLARAWSNLESHQRVLLALRAEGYGLPEIAEITGVAPSALAARLYRARQRLARNLGDEQGNETESRREIAK